MAKKHAPNVPPTCPLFSIIEKISDCICAYANGHLRQRKQLFARTRTVICAYANGTNPYPRSL